MDKYFDAIVILASAYNKRTGKLDNDTISRLNKGVNIWRDRGRQFILLSGDNDNLGKGLSITEDMRKVLLKHSVPNYLIKTESKSRNTQENLLMSLEIIEDMQWKKICIISNSAHIFRIKYYWKRIKKTDSSTSEIEVAFRESSYLNWWSFLWEILSWGKIIVSRLQNRKH